MSGPVVAAFRTSVHTTWIRPWASTARSGSRCAFTVTSFTRTFAEKLSPLSVDFEKYTSAAPFR